MNRKFRYEKTNNLGSTDLQEERKFQGGQAFTIYILDVTGHPFAPTAEALYVCGRLGIAWGADATWADVFDDDIEGAIDMWLNDPDEWDSHN